MKTYKFLIFSSIILIITFLIHLTTTNTKGILDYSHKENSKLIIQAGALSSTNGIIPFSYNKLKICDPKKIIKAEDSLGEILTGEKLFNTAYIAYTATNTYCETLCENPSFDKESFQLIQTLIRRDYFINWYLDKLPAGLLTYNKSLKKKFINHFNGIPLGYLDKKTNNYYIYNHLEFHILINKIKNSSLKLKIFDNENEINKYNIVGFNILPLSIKHENGMGKCSKKGGDDLLNNYDENLEPQILTQDKEILFTYDTIFEYSNITFASRWDHYKTSNKSIHWLSLISSQLIIVFLSLIIGFILYQNIKQKIGAPHSSFHEEKIILDNDYSWINVSGDVFRPPFVNPMLLSAIIGTGVQLFLMLTITLFLGILGFLNPEKRTNIINIGIFIFCIMGFPGGFISTKIYIFFSNKKWFFNALLTSLIFPGTIIFGYAIINILLTKEQSSAAVGLGDIFKILCLWIFGSFPLEMIGSFLATKTKKINIPCEINPIPSIIPKKPWYLHYKFLAFFTGIICFGSVFVELSYVMGALWRHQIYFLATFLWVAILLFIWQCAEISIIIVYWNLNYGDYNWWWKSFLIGASPVIYFVLYSIYYFYSLQLRRFSAIIVYFGIMSMISAMCFFICGGISVLITFFFIKFIYSQIKSK